MHFINDKQNVIYNMNAFLDLINNFLSYNKSEQINRKELISKCSTEFNQSSYTDFFQFSIKNHIKKLCMPINPNLTLGNRCYLGDNLSNYLNFINNSNYIPELNKESYCQQPNVYNNRINSNVTSIIDLTSDQNETVINNNENNKSNQGQINLINNNVTVNQNNIILDMKKYKKNKGNNILNNLKNQVFENFKINEQTNNNNSNKINVNQNFSCNSIKLNNKFLGRKLATTVKKSNCGDESSSLSESEYKNKVEKVKNSINNSDKHLTLSNKPSKHMKLNKLSNNSCAKLNSLQNDDYFKKESSSKNNSFTKFEENKQTNPESSLKLTESNNDLLVKKPKKQMISGSLNSYKNNNNNIKQTFAEIYEKKALVDLYRNCPVVDTFIINELVNNINNPSRKFKHSYSWNKENKAFLEKHKLMKQDLQEFKTIFQSDLEESLRSREHLFMNTHFKSMYEIENYYLNIHLVKKRKQKINELVAFIPPFNPNIGKTNKNAFSSNEINESLNATKDIENSNPTQVDTKQAQENKHTVNEPTELIDLTASTKSEVNYIIEKKNDELVKEFNIVEGYVRHVPVMKKLWEPNRISEEELKEILYYYEKKFPISLERRWSQEVILELLMEFNFDVKLLDMSLDEQTFNEKVENRNSHTLILEEDLVNIDERSRRKMSLRNKLSNYN